MPSKLLERPDKEPTIEELDAEISGAGMDFMLDSLPQGEIREGFREGLRHQFKVAYYEKNGKVVDGVVPIVIDGTVGFIHPVSDTDWNFQRFLVLMNQVFVELGKHL
jgi:hypothetical protein